MERTEEPKSSPSTIEDGILFGLIPLASIIVTPIVKTTTATIM